MKNLSKLDTESVKFDKLTLEYLLRFKTNVIVTQDKNYKNSLQKQKQKQNMKTEIHFMRVEGQDDEIEISLK